MKNLKKILALAVAFVMCFTMFAGAATFTDVTLGGDYSQAITFLSDLGVIAGKPDGSFGVNDAITRADAACLIARLMTGQPTPQKYDGHIAFTDVPAGSYYETSVGYCAALGITVGKGNGRFAPEDTITDGEFIAMLTRALGYDTAEHPLAFPMGNITQAQARGLLDGVKVEYASDALRGEDAQMLYNALFAEYDRAAANKNLYQGADDHWNVTIAEEAFGLGRLSHDTAQADDSNIGRQSKVAFHGANRNNNPVVDCDAHTWVIAGVDARNDENTYVAIAIDDDEVKAIDPENTAWAYQLFTYSGDIKPLLGYRVELWGEYDHSTPVWDVTAIKVVDGSLSDSRASTAGFQSRYAANQATYKYQPGMDDDDDTVTIDGKELYINKNNNRAYNAKINLNIDNRVGTSARGWMWATEDTQYSPTTAGGYPAPAAVYAGFDNTFASDGPDVSGNYADAYRVTRVDASDDPRPDPESNDDFISLNFRDGDQYTLFDWDGDDKIDFVVTDTAKYAEVVTKTATRMVIEAEDRDYTGPAATYNRASGQYSLKLDDDNLKVEGADSVEEGDIIEITVVSRVYDRADGEVVTIKVATVEPEVKKLEKVNLTREEYTFDGEVVTKSDIDLFDRIDMSATGTSMDELDTIENIGKEFDLWFNRNGFLIKARVKDDSASGYLMILETLDGQENLHTNVTASKRGLALADVLFDDNTVGEEVEFVKNLSIDSSTSGNGYESSTRSWNEKMVVGNIYKYYMNEDGQITRLISKTDTQGANYSFDESKNRLQLNGTTNYGFDSDAVVFAVRPVKTTLAGSTVADESLGYVQSGTRNHWGVTGGPDAIHYWVDPADVMAVSIEDVPEIDNRHGTITAVPGAGLTEQTIPWNTPSYDVTHPARFISWDYAAIDNFAGNTANPADRWIEEVAESDWNDEDWNYRTTRNNPGPNTYTGAATSANTTIPSIAFHANSDREIEAAIFGVDSLDFFGASSVKLALISNVYSLGKKTYEFKAAIDGKYDTFKTISADEDKIFKGRINGNQASYNNMISYLNQRDDSYTGRYRALYAEVVMDKDGLIREVRALEPVTPGVGDTYWGNDAAKVTFLEGSVYRVVRGVTNQLLAKNLVTWITGPFVSGSNTLYYVDDKDDYNAYDHLEASYDEDTDFYYIDQKPGMGAIDSQLVVTDGFRDDIDGDIKATDSSVLVESQFSTRDGDAVYNVADFAVYKNNMDRLAAVFAFNDEITNLNDNGKVIDLDDGMFTTANDTAGAQVGGSKVELQFTDFTGAAGNTLTLNFNVDGTAKDIDFVSAATPSATLTALKTAIDADTDLNSLVTVAVKNGVLTLTPVAAGAPIAVSGDLSALGYGYSVKNVAATTQKDAVAKITVKSGTLLNVNGDTTKANIVVSANDGVLASTPVANRTITLGTGNYTATSIAAAIANKLDAIGGSLSVTRDGNVVTITDSSANGNLDLVVTVQ